MGQNVWADLGFEQPETMQRKCDLSIEIEHTMKRAGLSVRDAAAKLAISDSSLRAILRGEVESVNVDALEQYVKILSSGALQRS